MAANFAEFDSKCKKTIEHFKKDLGRLRTGRAAPSLLDGLQVDYYGSHVPLIQLGMVNAPEARLLTIQVYDANACEAIEKAIQQSDLGLNPSRDGSLIRIVVPPLNEERRKDIIKKLHKMAEDVRVSLRNHRREVIDDIKKKEKGKEMSADDSRRGQEEVQKITDKHTKEIDVLLAGKEKEMMEV
jgi:ribosome recycling factor